MPTTIPTADHVASIIGRAARKAESLSRHLRDLSTADTSGLALTDEQSHAVEVLTAWAQRTEKRGRPSRDVVAARAILDAAGIDYLESTGSGVDVTTSEADRADALAASMAAHARKAALLLRLIRVAGDDDRAIVALASEAKATTALWAGMTQINRAAYLMWRDNDGKSHLTGQEATDKLADGTHWTRSLKGDVSEQRHIPGLSDGKRHLHSLGQSGWYRLMEADILKAEEGEQEA